VRKSVINKSGGIPNFPGIPPDVIFEQLKISGIRTIGHSLPATSDLSRNFPGEYFPAPQITHSQRRIYSGEVLHPCERITATLNPLPLIGISQRLHFPFDDYRRQPTPHGIYVTRSLGKIREYPWQCMGHLAI
jgi:hypothetical protein